VHRLITSSLEPSARVSTVAHDKGLAIQSICFATFCHLWSSERLDQERLDQQSRTLLLQPPRTSYSFEPAYESNRRRVGQLFGIPLSVFAK
jgi:hypothetical protein